MQSKYFLICLVLFLLTCHHAVVVNAQVFSCFDWIVNTALNCGEGICPPGSREYICRDCRSECNPICVKRQFGCEPECRFVASCQPTPPPPPPPPTPPPPTPPPPTPPPPTPPPPTPPPPTPPPPTPQPPSPVPAPPTPPPSPATVPSPAPVAPSPGDAPNLAPTPAVDSSGNTGTEGGGGGNNNNSNDLPSSPAPTNIVAIAVPVALVLVLCVVGFLVGLLIVRRRRRRQQQSNPHDGGVEVRGTIIPMNVMPESPSTSWSPPINLAAPPVSKPTYGYTESATSSSAASNTNFAPLAQPGYRQATSSATPISHTNYGVNTNVGMPPRPPAPARPSPVISATTQPPSVGKVSYEAMPSSIPPQSRPSATPIPQAEIRRALQEGQYGAPNVAPVVIAPTAADSLRRMLVPSSQVKLGKELGRGAFGVVYEATFQKRKVACKMLTDKSANMSEFEKEATTLSSITAPFLPLFG